jgi:nucleobase:cation symporter-1, NCS1 family
MVSTASSVAPSQPPGTDAALEESLPLTRASRQWSFIDVVCVKSGLAIATWAFLFGGATAQLVGFWDGLFAIFVGNAIGVILLLLGVILPSAKWGTEFYVHQRSVYGPRGALIFFFIVAAIPVIGWAALLATMTGKAVAEIARSTFPPLPIGGEVLATIVSLVVLFTVWRLVVRGSRGVRWLNLLAAPLLILLCVWLMGAIFSKVTFAEIVAAPPVKPPRDHLTNIMLAIELNVAAGLGWFSLAANLGRFATTQRAAVWGSFVGYVLVNGLAFIVGLTSALVLGSADPVTWMVPIVGVFGGAVLLLILVLANLTSLVSMVHGNSQSVLQILGPRAQALGWAGLTGLIVLGAAIIVVVATDALYDRFST